MKRKKWFVLLCAVMVLAAFPYKLLFAKSSAGISVNDAWAEAGDEVSISISLASNPGIAYLKLRISYSEDLEIVGVENKGVLEGAFTSSKSISENPYTCLWSNATDSTGNGELAVITFKAADAAEAGSKGVTVEVCECYNQNLDDVSITGDTAEISVSVSLAGSGESQNVSDEVQSDPRESEDVSAESEIVLDESQNVSDESQGEDLQIQDETKSDIGQSGGNAGDNGVIISLAATLAICGTFILLIKNTKLLKR